MTEKTEKPAGARKPRAKAPENETKAEKFKRIGNGRLKTVLEDIRILGQMANTAVYEYTDEQKDRVFAHVEAAVAKLREDFANGGKVVVESAALL